MVAANTVALRYLGMYSHDHKHICHKLEYRGRQLHALDMYWDGYMWRASRIIAHRSETWTFLEAVMAFP